MFLETIREEDATGKVAESYAADRARLGFVMSATACWTARPDLLPAWEAFYAQVKANFSLSPRDWRLITFIAAKQVPSSYCSMVYGKMLLDDLGSRDKVLAVQADFRAAGLGERDTAMLAHAEAVARDASRVTERDIGALRAVGFRDVQIADIALCAALRCFMARFFDATGAGPEAAFIDPDGFAIALAVGRKPS
ncbi:carboxymuconolactone decarboxylase family protein [Inquilinus sp. OTU3971]|uniref:carboxymuconolactone decarboxylase family protein n=1 Tax=Inquilinus sp. OTU3971 TaxID=3043855 RepID=UPI00313D1EE8